MKILLVKLIIWKEFSTTKRLKCAKHILEDGRYFLSSNIDFLLNVEKNLLQFIPLPHFSYSSSIQIRLSNTTLSLDIPPKMATFSANIVKRSMLNSTNFVALDILRIFLCHYIKEMFFFFK